jgi:prephenate dehydratase
VIKVAFQGERGAFSEDAVVSFFGEVELFPRHYIADVFEAVLGNDVDFGVVPVENSQAGSINDTYDLLLKYPLNIYGEIHLRISHCLMALPGETLNEITIIYSHPQALAQCEEFLRKLKADIVPTYDTAGSAKRIKEVGLKGSAAVASKRAAKIYALEILAEGIETNPNNYTRFFVISKKKAEPAPKSKTSLVFGTKNLPGALYHCLGAFATRNINLTKLESRPARDKPWEYIFYVDFEGHLDDQLCRKAMIELNEMTNFIKILGSYPRASG